MELESKSGEWWIKTKKKGGCSKRNVPSYRTVCDTRPQHALILALLHALLIYGRFDNITLDAFTGRNGLPEWLSSPHIQAYRESQLSSVAAKNGAAWREFGLFMSYCSLDRGGLR